MSLNTECRISTSLAVQQILVSLNTECRISASLLVQQILVSLNTECRISASWFGSECHYLNRCWVLGSVDLGVFGH